MHKRGQAATEFVITYGWVMLIIISLLFGLFYYGVVDLDMYLDETCTFPAGIDCIDYSWDNDGFLIVVRNSFGFDIQNISLTIDPEQLGTICITATIKESIGLLNTKTQLFSINCSDMGVITTFKGNLIFTFETAETDIPHQKVGFVLAKLRR